MLPQSAENKKSSKSKACHKAWYKVDPRDPHGGRENQLWKGVLVLRWWAWPVCLHLTHTEININYKPLSNGEDKAPSMRRTDVFLKPPSYCQYFSLSRSTWRTRLTWLQGPCFPVTCFDAFSVPNGTGRSAPGSQCLPFSPLSAVGALSLRTKPWLLFFSHVWRNTSEFSGSNNPDTGDRKGKAILTGRH